jgi:hypothetical protein
VAGLGRVGAQGDRVELLGFQRHAMMRRQAVDEDRPGTGQRLDQRVAAVVACQREVHDGAARNRVLCDEKHFGRQPLGDEDRGFGHGGVRDQPVDRAARGFLDVDARQQKLDEGELCVGIDSVNRRHRRGDP